MQNKNITIDSYLKELKEGKHKFENAFELLAHMLFNNSNFIKPILVNGRNTYDFLQFRMGKKHIIGLFEVINKFVAFIKDAAENGESKEMAFVLVGEPGNGKTFFVDYLSSMYRKYIAIPENNKYTFRINLPADMEGYGKIREIESQTFEESGDINDEFI